MKAEIVQQTTDAFEGHAESDHSGDVNKMVGASPRLTPSSRAAGEAIQRRRP
jgi:hypothetical protein